MNKWAVIGAAVAGTLVLSSLLVVGGDRLKHSDPDAVSSMAGTPWQIEALPGGRSRILGPAGLVLGGQAGDQPAAGLLADVRRLWPDTTQIAIVAAPGENGTLEAFVDPVTLGFVTGKLVVSLALPEDQIRTMRERSPKAEFMESTTRKYTLAPDDLQQALAAPISAVTLIPQAQLDEETVVQRFGSPAERVAGAAGVTHLLYPERGLDVAIHAEGKDLLQYVAPAHFERLRAPLHRARAASQP